MSSVTIADLTAQCQKYIDANRFQTEITNKFCKTIESTIAELKCVHARWLDKLSEIRQRNPFGDGNTNGVIEAWSSGRGAVLLEEHADGVLGELLSKHNLDGDEILSLEELVPNTKYVIDDTTVQVKVCVTFCGYKYRDIEDCVIVDRRQVDAVIKERYVDMVDLDTITETIEKHLDYGAIEIDPSDGNTSATQWIDVKLWMLRPRVRADGGPGADQYPS